MRLLVVDDHPQIRLGLRRMVELETPFEVVGDAANGEEAIERVDEVRPDLVIMDAKMPQMDGAEATRRIKERFPDIQILAFSGTGELPRVAPMLDAGASGYVLKGTTPDSFVDSVERWIHLP